MNYDRTRTNTNIGTLRFEHDFSDSSPHRINPVTGGQRLAAVFWIQSLVREDVKRQLLFDLDRTIQRLTQLRSDEDSLVRLTAHYHGLLRLWTEV